MSKYYIIRNKNLAITISYLLGVDFYTMDDRFNEGRKCYSFENTERFKKTFDKVQELKNEI